MIEQRPAYWIGQQLFPTIQEAQRTELQVLLSDGGQHVENGMAVAVIDSIITHADEVVAILTQEPKVKTTRKPRCDIGKKRGKKDATPTVL
jgi:hypothetical protein